MKVLSLFVTERHLSAASPPEEAIRKAVVTWLKKELYK